MIFIPVEKGWGAIDCMFGWSLFDKEAGALARLFSTLPLNDALPFGWE